MRDLILPFLFLCFSIISAKKVYDHYSVFKIVPKTEQQIKLLQKIKEKTPEYDFWNPVQGIGRPILIMVSPDLKDKFASLIRANRISAQITIPDLQRLITREEIEARYMRLVTPGKLTWIAYHTLNEIYEWLKYQENNKNFKVTRVQVGTTWEKRPIYGLKIMSEGTKQPEVLMEAGMHAREWIAPAALTWVVDQILHVKDKNSIWHKFNYLFIPVANPDGYEYAHNKNRMWRKSRKPYFDERNFPCIGADLNRNWASHWMEAGSSDQPCQADFAGPEPFSEIEAKSVADYYKSHERFDIFLSFHSYGQYILFPYDHTGRKAPLHDLWEKIGKAAAKAIKAVDNKTFKVGNVHDIIYPASGSSMGWYYEQFNSTLTYTFELRDEGNLGFMLPANQIIPSGEEVKAAIEKILEEYLKI